MFSSTDPKVRLSGLDGLKYVADLFTEALQQLYIIERTPEPEDLRDMPAVNLPRAVLQKVKRERDDGSRIKPEPHAKRHKYTTTIDLTGDSSDVEDNVIVLD